MANWTRTILLRLPRSLCTVELRGRAEQDDASLLVALLNAMRQQTRAYINTVKTVVAICPLLGLLGTVTGMFTTFDGIAAGESSKFAIIISGVSEALITTQGGLIISIPAFVLLSFIIQRRSQLERCLSRLEQYNIRIAMRRDG